MIALIGSPGALADAVVAALRAEGREAVVCRLDDGSGAGTPGVVSFRVEQAGSLMARLRDMGVTEVCFAGGIGRPRIDPTKIDAATLPLVPKMLRALGKGDDGALRVVIEVFEEAGFAVRGAHEIAPSLLPMAGCLSRARPTAGQEADARRAEEVHRVLAPADVGQGVVVRGGQVIAVEAQPGTDWMLRSIQGVADGALLLKAPKAGQDRRADLPVIGPATVALARDARLAVVAVEAGGVMVLERDACAALADEAGLVLWVREAGP